jgi:hypothetical protein
MPGLVPGIHVLKVSQKAKTWMAGHSRLKDGVTSFAYARP